jgi:membrane-bound metal-dependent hydrolase YbcI (DUF457 family)
MKKQKKGLGKLIYSEWLIPIVDYYKSLYKNETCYEVIVPILIAIICTIIYSNNGKLVVALNGIAKILPTVISILIGFTVMLITILLTSTGENIEKLKNTETDKLLRDKNVTLYQKLHIQFSHSLFSEVLLLLLIFFYLFLYGLWGDSIVGFIAYIFLMIEIYLILNILLSILRGITNMYFSFYRSN